MMKNKRVVLAVALTLTMLITICASLRQPKAKEGEAFSLELNELTENPSEEFLENQNEANAIYSRIFEYLRETYGATCDDSVYTVNGIIAENYPAYFAGAYLNTEGRLVVQIVDSFYCSAYRESEWYQELVGIVGSEAFYCHPVKYSYSELINAISAVTLGNLAEAFSADGIQIVDAAIDDYRNWIDVHFRTQEDYDAVISSLNSDIYSVSVAEGIIEDTVGVYPGEGASKSSSGGATFSLACRVRRNNPDGSYDYGFLTCAHAFSGNSNVYLCTGSATNTLIGCCYSSNQKLGGSVDVAFFVTNSYATLYDTVFGSTVTLYHTYSTTMGSIVYMRGAGSNAVTSGQVLNSSYSAPVGGIPFTDMVSATYSAVGGDSGGIVFNQPDSTDHAYPVGIQKGKQTSGSYSFFTKMYNDLAALQSGPITFSLY